MNIKVLYLTIFSFLSLLSIYFFLGDVISKPIEKKRFRNMFKYNNELDHLFLKSGIKIKGFYYQLTRYIIFIFWILSIIYTYITYNIVLKLQIITLFIVFFITSPRLTFLGQKTLFAYVIDVFTKEYKTKKDKELFRIIIQLKNLSFANSNWSYGSDFIIEEIMKFTNVTKPIFSKMLSIWQLGNREEAVSYFANEIDTKIGKQLANLFLKLDYLSISDFKEQLDLFLSSIKAEMHTEMERRNTRRGNILYISMVMAASFVLLNFVVIVLYIDVIRNLILF